MPITFRNYDPTPGLTEDYARVRAFLLALGRKDFSFGRWDWMITHSMLDTSALGRIGIWESDGAIVALTSFDTMPGDGHFCLLPGYDGLQGETFHYAAAHFADAKGRYRAIIPEGDTGMQRVAAQAGFVASQDTEPDALYCLEDTDYTLPEGFTITSMAERYDPRQYLQVLYKGFNHEQTDGPFAPTDADLQSVRCEMERPNVDLSLKVAVAAPNGDFVSYCGMWYDPAVDFAIVEPVATDPVYRRMGLGRAAVREGIRRCYAQGAKRAFVGSSQDFYYAIGFWPYGRATSWRKA